MAETEPRTRLAKQIMNGDFGEVVPVVADGEYGLLEVVLFATPGVSPAGVQRFFLIVRNSGLGRQTSYHIDVPLERDAEAGARTYKDRTV